MASPSRFRFFDVEREMEDMGGGGASMEGFRRCGREEEAVSTMLEWRDDGVTTGTVGEGGASVVRREEIDMAPLRGVDAYYH